MTAPVDTDHIDALSQAATAGPWVIHEANRYDHIKTESGRYVCEPIRPPRMQRNDVALIVALRNSWPSLSAELKAARAVVEAARKVYLLENDIIAPDYELSASVRDMADALQRYDKVNK
jgi:hypothetical protein